jgi:hypothetical protein
MLAIAMPIRNEEGYLVILCGKRHYTAQKQERAAVTTKGKLVKQMPNADRVNETVNRR